MEITVAKTAGFCPGVKRAVGMAYDEARKKDKTSSCIYTYGPIIHNEMVIKDLEGTDEAVISIYRQGEMEGSFVDHGNGELSFTSEDGSVKGMIKIDGWNGANFKVTETKSKNCPFEESGQCANGLR
jgi:hypothetical protein